MADASQSRNIYLNDHLAGADAALDLLEDMTESDDSRLAALARVLHVEISEDREQLEAVMERLDVSRTRTKEMLASLAESVSRLALSRVGAPDAVARLLEIEALSSGVWGKKRLWRSLLAASGLRAALGDIDLEELEARADRQLARIDEEHRRVAVEALEG